MCRSVRDGGRRCPCANGDRRRAYARSRYAARNAEAARRAANTAEFTRRFVDTQGQMLVALADAGEESSAAAAFDLESVAPAAVTEPDPEPPPLGSVIDEGIEKRYGTPIEEMTGVDRERVRTYATVRAQLCAQATSDAYAAMAGTYHYHDTAQRRAYEAALQEQGRHLAAVADVTLHENLQDTLPDPDDRDAVGSVAWVARMIVDSGFVNPEGTPMSVSEVIAGVRAGKLDDQAPQRIRALNKALLDARQAVQHRRAEAHATALRATLLQVNPDLRFGSADLVAGRPVVWGTGMTKAKQARFAADLHAAYPDQLLDHARDGGRALRVRATSSRAHYQPSGAHEAVPAAHYLDARDLIAAARATENVGDPLVRAAQLQTKARYATRYTVARFAVPSSGGVPDTAANREALEAAFHAWSGTDNPYYDKRFATTLGSSPKIHAADGMLYVTSRKRVPSLPGKPIAELTTNGARNVTVHEMAHRIEEQTPAIAAACHAFLARRTEGLDPTVYNTSIRRGRRVVEKVREDSFVDPYIGRDYGPDQPHTEVFSVGMEALVTGGFGGLINSPEAGWADQQRRADPEHRQLLLALLASAPGLVAPPE